MSYGGDSEFTGKSISTINQQKQQALAKAQQIQQQNQAVQEQRAKAPGTVASGSPQDISIRAQEAQAAQQRMVSENVHQIGYTGDLYAQEREAALKSGKFDYGSFGQQIPQSYLTSKGIRVERPTYQMMQGGTPVIGKPEPKQPGVVGPTILSQTSTSGAFFGGIRQPVIQMSQQQLMRTNALRAEQGLPPLETVTTVQIVKGGQSQPTKPTPKPDEGLVNIYTSTPTQTPDQAQSGEAVSFLTFPFERTLAKTPLANFFRPPPPSAQTGTKEVPATGLVDVLQFVPFGIGIVEKGITFAKTLPEAFVREFGPTTEEAATKGGADIGLGISKPNVETQKESDIIRDYNRFVEASKGKEPTKVQQSYADTIISKSFGESGNVDMGTGLGKVFSKGGEGVKPTDVFSKPPPEKPSPSEKTVSAGKGLEQIVKQKEVTKTVAKTKPEFESKQATKQEQYLKDQEQKALEKEKTATEQTQKTAIKEVFPTIIKTEEGHQGERVLLVAPEKPKEKPKQSIIPPQPKQGEELIPIYTSLTGQQQKEKQKEQGVGITDTLLITKTPGTTPPTPPPELTPPTETPTGKKTPPPELFGGLGGSLTGGGGRGEGSGAVKAFIGNVPESSIVGVYKRGEISYGSSSFKSSKSSTRKTISEKKMKLL